ncbi:EKC/KEOPS complex subunit [Schizosaccharomyces japonicus yFS275]|uniref:EKC/KEOPS complex subunit n=1 Tax=Schizosaccharomyces japonicus (strain yFS275 / FY16936) TaxID=402676 RepID=T0T6F9_SCHJY|nr:EKC/KEOPS complex subunit [Schizosaccharomyces japonicus yFS275]EQC53019.1 EKC/KEOPS complex subunit [Schizosaccharomyces japonicus yFS275]
MAAAEKSAITLEYKEDKVDGVFDTLEIPVESAKEGNYESLLQGILSMQSICNIKFTDRMAFDNVDDVEEEQAIQL